MLRTLIVTDKDRLQYFVFQELDLKQSVFHALGLCIQISCIYIHIHILGILSECELALEAMQLSLCLLLTHTLYISDICKQKTAFNNNQKLPIGHDMPLCINCTLGNGHKNVEKNGYHYLFFFFHGQVRRHHIYVNTKYGYGNT